MPPGGAPAPAGGAPAGGDPGIDAIKQVLMEVLPQVLPAALQQVGMTPGAEGGEKKKTGGKEQVAQLEQRIMQLEQMMGVPPTQAAPGDQEGVNQMAQGGAQPAQVPGPLSPEAGQLMGSPLPQQGLIQQAGSRQIRTGRELHEAVMTLLG